MNQLIRKITINLRFRQLIHFFQNTQTLIPQIINPDFALKMLVTTCGYFELWHVLCAVFLLSQSFVLLCAPLVPLAVNTPRNSDSGQKVSKSEQESGNNQ